MYNIYLNLTPPPQKKQTPTPQITYLIILHNIPVIILHDIPVSSYLIPHDLGFLHE